MTTITTPQYTLHLGDCRDFMRGMEAWSVVTVTDPPYGLGDRMSGGDSGEWSKGWSVAPQWDKETSGAVILLPDFCKCIIWGGNYYDLPPSRGWLIWDKIQEHSSGHAELAWTNLDIPIRTFRMSRVEAYSKMNKEHPTQKPLALMRWCIELVSVPGDVIFDPFMGSGTTGVAALQLGRKFIGCELDAGYFAIAQRRIEQAAAQPLLIAPDKPTPAQQAQF